MWRAMGDWGEAEALLRDAVACFKDADALAPANVKVLVSTAALQTPSALLVWKTSEHSLEGPLAHFLSHWKCLHSDGSIIIAGRRTQNFVGHDQGFAVSIAILRSGMASAAGQLGQCADGAGPAEEGVPGGDARRASAHEPRGGGGRGQRRGCAALRGAGRPPRGRVHMLSHFALS